MLEVSREVAEKAVKAKSTMMASLSHEIRTPLHGIIGTASLISETSLTDEQREGLTSMQVSIFILFFLLSYFSFFILLCFFILLFLFFFFSLFFLFLILFFFFFFFFCSFFFSLFFFFLSSSFFSTDPYSNCQRNTKNIVLIGANFLHKLRKGFKPTQSTPDCLCFQLSCFSIGNDKRILLQTGKACSNIKEFQWKKTMKGKKLNMNEVRWKYSHYNNK